MAAIQLTGSIDVGATFGPLALGRFDPTIRVEQRSVWRATRTPDGPGTIHVAAVDSSRIDVATWGPGARWLLDRAATVCGLHDGAGGFDPTQHPLVAEIVRRHGALRFGRTEVVLDRLVPTVLSQKVTGLEAKRGWRALVRLAGEPAPGPARLLLPPSAPWLAALPVFRYHRAGIERKRADTIRIAASRADRLQEAVALGSDVLAARLLALPGIGPWTVAEVLSVVLGDADAVSVGDYHLPHLVAWNLAGEPRADDGRMLELLAPFAPHRGRVIRLLERYGEGPPRYGPRLPARSIAAI